MTQQRKTVPAAAGGTMGGAVCPARAAGCPTGAAGCPASVADSPASAMGPARAQAELIEMLARLVLATVDKEQPRDTTPTTTTCRSATET